MQVHHAHVTARDAADHCLVLFNELVDLGEGQGRRHPDLDEPAIAEAYVRGDLESEGDAIRAMWFRNLLSDDRLWIKTWRRLQPLPRLSLALWTTMKINGTR